MTREALLADWESGFQVLFSSLDALSEADLGLTVTIRQQPLLVHEALHRSLAHTSYHVGQIVFAARGLRGADWRFLSIPPGQSAQYNAQPTMETPGAHLTGLRRDA